MVEDVQAAHSTMTLMLRLGTANKKEMVGVERGAGRDGHTGRRWDFNPREGS